MIKIKTEADMISKAQAKYFAYELTRINKDDPLGALSQALMNSQVDLQPHQIDAAAFALRSPLSNGVLLADEVGLGKTIEAGIIISQLWAERKRHLLIICPASLREQWNKELEDKFALPSVIVDRSCYIKDMLKLTDKIIIMSYNFAANIEQDLQPVPWDLVVMDEAHKVRNVYKTDNIIGNILKSALNGRKKLLLTATPLQNSLMELLGLSQLIDPGIFGDTNSFRGQYATAGKANEEELKDRLKTFCKRTLRSQVVEYIKYTERKPSTFKFVPSEAEQKLYDRVKDFLQKDSKYALPVRQRHLLELVLYKLLASSVAAIRGTFEAILARLEHLKEGKATNTEDGRLKELVTETYLDEEGDENVTEDVEIDINELNLEIAEVKDIIEQCKAIDDDTKAKTLLQALSITFQQMANEKGANPPLKKALIFTESRRTQDYLNEFLSKNGYKDKIVLFNGGNKEKRAELLEKFKQDAEIMIATEAGAEGLNMQFCSLVINYDLPWNPQRVEQRIGRCHRYGQKHDVIVINFINQNNHADQRIFELLNDKFNLFCGVFGASDEVLGAIEDGIDFEKKILQICKTCRTAEEIENAFNQLQKEMEESISARMKDTKRKVLDLLDADVLRKMKINLEKTSKQLTEHQQMFWRLCKHILAIDGVFNDEEFSFELTNDKLGKLQKYYFITCEDKRTELDNSVILRLTHPISSYVLENAKNQDVPVSEIIFDVANNPMKETVLQNMLNEGVSGWCDCRLLTIDSLEHEEYLVLSGIDSNGNSVSQDVLKKILGLNIQSENVGLEVEPGQKIKLDSEASLNIEKTRQLSNNRNKDFVQEEIDKIDAYNTDKIVPLEKELKALDDDIKRLTKEALTEADLNRSLLLQTEVQKLSKQKSQKRNQLWNLQDELEQRRAELIDQLKARLAAVCTVNDLFLIKWRLA